MWRGSHEDDVQQNALESIEPDHADRNLALHA